MKNHFADTGFFVFLTNLKTMKRLIFLAIILTGCSTMLPLQRSGLITAFHLIEDEEYAEAKAFIKNMVEDEEAAGWPRTWHARGLLYQNAYREGKQRNNRNLYEMKDRQLFVVYESYEKALALDAGSRIRNQLAPRYVLLANDIQAMGEQNFAEGHYDEALKAFETVEQIRQGDLLNLDTDTPLVYNMALAAIEGGQREKAIRYLHRLDEYRYGTNVSHLLSEEYLQQGDTLQAGSVLQQGIEKYDDNEDLVLLLADIHFSMGLVEESLDMLDSKSEVYPSNHKFPYTKGLILQKTGNYGEAIVAYEESLELEPEKPMTYVHIATCYYNIGIEIEERARTINRSAQVQDKRERSTAALESATIWLNKALELEKQDPEALATIRELSALLDITERVESVNDEPLENDELNEESDAQ